MRKYLRKYDSVRPLRYVLPERLLLGAGLYTIFLFANCKINLNKASTEINNYLQKKPGYEQMTKEEALDRAGDFISKAFNLNAFD